LPQGAAAVDQADRVILRVVQDLDLKQVAGIVLAGTGINQALDYMPFIVDR
jgi:hypothetical protein